MAPVGTELPIRKVLGVGQSPGARGMESPHTRSRSSGIPAPGSPQSEQGRWGGLPCGILGRKPCTVWRGKEGRCRRGQEDPGGPLQLWVALQFVSSILGHNLIDPGKLSCFLGKQYIPDQTHLMPSCSYLNQPFLLKSLVLGNVFRN